jgi:hypothetical protein
MPQLQEFEKAGKGENHARDCYGSCRRREERGHHDEEDDVSDSAGGIAQRSW